jgi:glycosyltransferase involved in cell wall biosynthesis
VRILSVAWECPQEPYGGLGVFVSRLLPEMAVSGHEVAHYCMHGVYPPLLPRDYHGVRVIRVHEPLVDRSGGVLNLTAMAFSKAVFNSIPMFDAVIGHDAHAALVVAEASEVGVSSGYYVHMWTYSPIDMVGVASAKEVFANSLLTLGEIKKLVNRRIHVVYPASPYPPVDSMSEKRNEKPVVVIPSRLQQNKSPEHVLKILEKVREFIDYEVVVFGRWAENYSLPEWIVNKGTVSEEEKTRLYASADLVLQVGFPEPFGLVALEAVALGTPVLVSEASGVSEVMPREAVYSLDSLADKLMQLLSSKNAREELWFKERNSVIMKRTWHDVWAEIEREIVKHK